MFALYLEHDYERGLAVEEELLGELRGRPEPFRISNALTLLGLLSTVTGRHDGARAALQEAIAILRKSGDMPSLASALQLTSFALLADGRAEQAAILAARAEAIREPMGSMATGLDILSIEDPRIGARQTLGDEAYEAAAARGRLLDLDGALAAALGPAHEAAPG